MEIVHIAAELAPIAKIGGLGDVLQGLSKALQEENHKVEIILPKYNTLITKYIENFAPASELKFDFGGKSLCKVWKGKVNGVPVAFIDAPHYFERGSVYGCSDDAVRFAFFSKAACEYLAQNKRNPDVLHIHDWHSSLVAKLYRDLYVKAFPKAKVVLTIHNLYYRGICPQLILDKVGLERAKCAGLLEHNQVNLLKGGIVYSDAVTTVSPTYAREALQHKEDPFAVLLKSLGPKFKGILNGIDFEYWDPATDPLIPVHFSAKDLKSSKPFLKGKKEVQTILRRRLSLDEETMPLVACITRLTPQKGPHLIKQALYRSLERGGQFVFCGSAPEGEMHEIFSHLKKKFKGSRHVHIELNYDEELSHLIYAGADLFVVPSIFEPCGLTQMISMRYGTLPLVRQTGGLEDTVVEGVNGFSFVEPNYDAIELAIDRAFWCWEHDPARWEKMLSQAMRADHSWKIPAGEYVKLYSA